MNRFTRLPDWPERLSDAIKAASGRPFSWGVHDCALFAADCAIAVTGVDPLADVRGEYSSARGAVRVLRRLGCVAPKAREPLDGVAPKAREPLDGVAPKVREPLDGVAQLADLLIGVRVPLVHARRGDWVMSPPADGAALGVCMGARAMFLQETGLTVRPTLACASAWAIGE